MIMRFRTKINNKDFDLNHEVRRILIKKILINSLITLINLIYSEEKKNYKIKCE